MTTTNALLELQAVNEILASVGQAPVTTIETQTLTFEDGTEVTEVSNPDVAIVLNTLNQTSREVQAEGWTFNIDYNVKVTPVNGEILIPDNYLQIDVNESDNSLYSTNRDIDVVRREGKLYDRVNQTFTFTEPIYCDIKKLYNWEDLPIPIRDYIVARSATIFSQRTIGDSTQYQMLQQREAYTRAMALEYECNQGDFTYFGSPQGKNYYVSYKPYRALYR